jgi:hypothetical protein
MMETPPAGEASPTYALGGSNRLGSSILCPLLPRAEPNRYAIDSAPDSRSVIMKWVNFNEQICVTFDERRSRTKESGSGFPERLQRSSTSPSPS